jgi:hypothetical protein
MRLNPSSSYHFTEPHSTECVGISALSLTGEKLMVNVMHVLVLVFADLLFLLERDFGGHVERRGD